MVCVYLFYDLSRWVGCWYWFLQGFFHILECPSDCTTVVGRLGRKLVNHTRLVAAVTATDRTKSVRNRRVIKMCGGYCVAVLLSVGISHREDAGGLSREYVLRIPSVS